MKRSPAKDMLKFTEGIAGLYTRGNLSNPALVDLVYHESGILEQEGWSNVPLHCLLVALISERLADLAGIKEKNNLILAGLFHDILKFKERKRAKELQEGGLPEGESFTRAAEEQSVWLEGVGVVPEVVEISRLSGHTSLAFFKSGKGNLNTAIFHLADDLAGGEDGTEVVMVDIRMAALAVRYPWLKTEGRDVLNGETYFEVQRRLAEGILSQIAAYAGISGEELNTKLVEEFKGWDDQE